MLEIFFLQPKLTKLIVIGITGPTKHNPVALGVLWKNSRGVSWGNLGWLRVRMQFLPAAYFWLNGFFRENYYTCFQYYMDMSHLLILF